MSHRSIPEWLRHAPAPGMHGFAALAACEAFARGMLISVFPLATLRALGDAQSVSAVYFGVGLLSMLVGLMVPWLNRYVPRRFLFAGSNLLYVAGCLLGATGGMAVLPALLACTAATAGTFVCFNAYVLDYIARSDLGRSESLRIFYAALGWTVGPGLGVALLGWWWPAPFLLAALAAATMLAIFLFLRLGNGKLITRARGPAANPVAYLRRFFAQPRLVAGWLFAVIRSCGWWVYIVYLPIFAIGAGLSEALGGLILSASNALLFLSPLILKAIQRTSVRGSVRVGFIGAALGFLAALVLAGAPPVAVASLAVASFFLVVLDVCGGLPFLMAVKPSERTEMSAVYASFRDVSGILTPGAAWLVLLVAPLPGVFGLTGIALGAMALLAGRLHPRLGLRRPGSLKPVDADDMRRAA